MELINQNQLSECLTGELALDQDLIQSAIDEISERLICMNSNIENNDAIAWKSKAHRCVGNAATLGFNLLASTFRTAEHNAASDFERTTLLVELNQQLKETKQALTELGLI